jgi:hypothetical protein
MTMVVFGMLIVVAIIVAFAATKAKSGIESAEEFWPFYAKKPLSQPEQVLYFRLKSVLPEHIVLAQVQLSRILGVRKGHNFRAWYNRINRMSVDFLVCKQDSTIAAAIELDDSSHNRYDRQIADAKKDKALTSVSVRIIRRQAKKLPNETEIKQTLLPQEASPNTAFDTNVPKSAARRST